jgi:hypothetical protein
MTTPRRDPPRRGPDELVSTLCRLECLEQLCAEGNAQAGAALDYMWTRAPNHLRAWYLLKTRGFGALARWGELSTPQKRALWRATQELLSLRSRRRPGAREACALLLGCGAYWLLAQRR